MITKLLTVSLQFEHDVVLTRQRARQIAGLLGFDILDQTRVATAVSELARNVTTYANNGMVEFLIERDANPALRVVVSDNGPGIADLRSVLDGHFDSTNGAGAGIIGAKRLMDRFDIESSKSEGTKIVIDKFLPRSSWDHIPERISNVVEELSKRSSHNPFEEIQFQNQELLTLMEDLRVKDDELNRLNQELGETNRGVVALYSELDEKAGELVRASEHKSSFLSNMSHEFRTPLASILSLTDILLARMDGELTSEQEKQVDLIRGSAQTLFTLVNDLLDLAKIEAGKVDIVPGPFTAGELFANLRGTFRPLVNSERVTLLFEEPENIPMLYTDEGKLTQILRNFISNALKFTEKGTIRVSGRTNGSKQVTFTVEDTGIGIEPEFQELIFIEFSQVPGTHQKAKLGTGLGLPLSRKLARLLGGDVAVTSSKDVGSAFATRIPIIYSGQNENNDSKSIFEAG